MPARADSPGLVPSGFFVMRTPLLPFDDFVAWGEGLTAAAADPGDLAAAIDQDRALLRERLRAFLRRAEVSEAIYVASPVAHDMAAKWIAEPSGQASDAERALVRYLARMTGRCTPFGLFAGGTTGRIAAETHLELQPRAAYRRTTRLDAGYLVRFIEDLLDTPEAREAQTYRANPTVYRAASRARYVRSEPAADESRHRLVSVRHTRSLDIALEAAAQGASLDGVAAAVATTGPSPERSREFVDEMAREHLLLPDLDLQVTGGDAVYGLGSASAILAEAATETASIDEQPLGLSPARYGRLVSLLNGLPQAKGESGHRFQVDMAKPGEATTLASSAAEELRDGAELFRRIAYRPGPDAVFERFISRFTDRFEERAVPLLEALDPDLGVPYDDDAPAQGPLLAGLGGEGPQPRTVRWGPREDYLLARLAEHQRSGALELVLTQRDIEKLESPEGPPFPDACAVMGTLSAPSERDLAQGNFRVLVTGIDGPSGARMFGRFCHTDPELMAAVEEHLRAEEALHPEAIFAEIVHLPRARDVNVVARPTLRAYEIPCLGKSGVSEDHQIPLSDLLVSVESGEIVLRSRRLERRVIPRLTSAHNYASRGVAVYRFLCRLQGQGLRGGLGLWGPLEAAPFLPRVRHGRVILSLARWRITANALGPRGDSTADFRAIQDWRRTWAVPRFVAQTDFGGQMPIDLENVLAVESLVDDVRSRGTLDLAEFFPAAEELVARGPEGAFAHELVVPFLREGKQDAPPRGLGANVDVRRVHPPGAEWLYARLYLGESLSDAALLETLVPLAEDLVGRGVAEQWFFMRYGDPEYHIRIRFHGHPAALHAEAIPALQAAARALMDQRIVWRIEYGTYHREVERYGGPDAIDHVEAVFHADSDAVAAILALLDPGEPGMVERWQLGLAGTHHLLVDLGLDEPQRLALVKSQRAALARRVGWDESAMGKVGARFRKERADLERLMAAVPGDGHPLEPGLDILRQRSERFAAPMAELRRLEGASRLTMPISGIASSLLHMYLNRLVRVNNVAEELVVCDFLVRLYEARARRAGAR